MLALKPTHTGHQPGTIFLFGKNVYLEECSTVSIFFHRDSDIKFEISDFDSDNAPLDLIHLAKTAPPKLTKTVVYSVITQSW